MLGVQNFTAGQLERIRSLFGVSSAIKDDWIESVSATKITGQIQTAQIANGAVTPAKISGGVNTSFVAIDPVTGTSKTYTVTNGIITAVES